MAKLNFDLFGSGFFPFFFSFVCSFSPRRSVVIARISLPIHSTLDFVAAAAVAVVVVVFVDDVFSARRLRSESGN